MRINTIKENPVTMEGEQSEEVDPFTYLGAIDKRGGTDVDVAARIGKARVHVAHLTCSRTSEHLKKSGHKQSYASSIPM